MLLKFKSTLQLRYHNGSYGRIDNGETKDYPDDEANRLLADFPNNFEKALTKEQTEEIIAKTMEVVKEETEEKMEKEAEADEELEEEKEKDKPVEKQPHKMVTEEKPKTKKK